MQYADSETYLEKAQEIAGNITLGKDYIDFYQMLAQMYSKKRLVKRGLLLAAEIQSIFVKKHC